MYSGSAASLYSCSEDLCVQPDLCFLVTNNFELLFPYPNRTRLKFHNIFARCVPAVFG